MKNHIMKKDTDLHCYFRHSRKGYCVGLTRIYTVYIKNFSVFSTKWPVAVNSVAKIKFILWLILTLTFLSSADIALAQNGKTTNENGKEVRTSLEQRMQKKISVDFKDTPIDDCLRVLAQQANINVVKSPKVTGTVTATLTDVPLEEALNNILLTQGYTYVIDKNTVRIIPVGEDVEVSERMASKIYRITYADVAGVEVALKQFISKPGTIAVSLGTNNVIVTAKESELKAIDTFIQEIDRITPQVMVEVRIYDITSTDRLDLGVDWSIGTNSTLGTALGTGADGAQGTQGRRTEPFTRGTLNSSVNKAISSNNAIRFGILNSSVNIDMLLRAEQEDICATLLANPRIMTLDNVKAHFESIKEIPYQQQTDTGAGNPIGTTAFKNVGVKLDVTPHVTNDSEKLVRLKIEPEFSVQNGSVTIVTTLTAGSSSMPQPIVDTRKADTTLLVKDGQTIVLGGLRKKEINQQTNKIPLLGDIPVVGWAFKSHGEETVISELVVFITPKIIEQSVMAEADKKCLEKTIICSPTCKAMMLKPCQTDSNGTNFDSCLPK